MNTASLNQIQSKLTVGTALLVATCVVSVAFQSASHARISTLASATASAPVAQVIIEGKRMSADEKLAYDEAALGIARVEIVGKRLSQEEKLAMASDDELAGRHLAVHKKV